MRWKPAMKHVSEACEWDSAEEGMWIEREGIAMIT